MNVTTIGIDLAKTVFPIHAVDERGKAVLRKQLKRDQVAAFFANLPPCLIGMEACGSAHHGAYFSDRGRRNGAVGDAMGKRVSYGLNISQSYTVSLKRSVVGPVIGLGFGVGPVGRWRDRYAEAGLQGTERELPRGTPPVKVDVGRLVELTTHTKPVAAAHWSTRKMAAELGVSASTVMRHCKPPV